MTSDVWTCRVSAMEGRTRRDERDVRSCSARETEKRSLDSLPPCKVPFFGWVAEAPPGPGLRIVGAGGSQGRASVEPTRMPPARNSDMDRPGAGSDLSDPDRSPTLTRRLGGRKTPISGHRRCNDRVGWGSGAHGDLRATGRKDS